jgi:tetratricopeptide (TPR) repeat protein
MKNNLAILGMVFGLLFSQALIAADKVVVNKAAQEVATRQLKTVQQAQLLVQTGKFAEAYALLQPLEFDLSGDISFDYLLGISAVNTGKPDRATLALERVEAISPEYGDARLWLGIAYFQSNDMARAKKSFTGLLRKTSLLPNPKTRPISTWMQSNNKRVRKHLNRRRLINLIWWGQSNLGWATTATLRLSHRTIILQHI